jgi:hypothetical protein
MNSLRPSKTPPKKVFDVISCRRGLTANIGIGISESGLDDRECRGSEARMEARDVPEPEKSVSSDVEVRVGRKPDADGFCPRDVR